MKLHDNVSALLASIQSGLYAHQQAARTGQEITSLQFVTVSRQAGARGRSFARNLVQRLNELDPGERPWAAWDRELVERIAAEQQISESLVEQVESYHRSAFADILAAMFTPNAEPQLDECQLYRRVAQTVRGLARAGRAVIVGRGGVYATSDMSAGIHVRLVTPLAERIRHMAEVLNVSIAKATAEVHRLDREREAFHRRYWANKALLPEMFTLTLNTAHMSEQQLVNCVLPLLVQAKGTTTPQHSRSPIPKTVAAV